MPAPYLLVFRQKVVEAYEAGHGSFRQVGEQFGIGEATVNRWVAKARRGESLQPKVRRSRAGKITPEALRYILSLVEDEPEWTTQGLAEELNEVFGIQVKRHTVGRALRDAGYSRKWGSQGRQLPEYRV